MLIAVDTAARVLELSQLLDQLWPNENLSRYNIALLNYEGWSVIEFAKNQVRLTLLMCSVSIVFLYSLFQVEWMSEKILKLFEDKRDDPFKFKFIRACHSLEELDRIPEPKVVLASPPDLECGLARELFIRWAGDVKNSVVFTTRTSPGTLARILIDNPRKNSVVLEVRKRVKLEGDELEAYNAAKAERESIQMQEREQLASV